MSLLIRQARVVTPAAGSRPLRGPDLGRLLVLPATDVLVQGSRIAAIGRDLAAPRETLVMEAAGRVLLPGFVDCHTHACWAGDRIDEWEKKLQGASYLEILRGGGGIHATVRAVRAATEEQLAVLTRARLEAMLQAGTTTVEVKSGYGLSTVDELKMLRAIRSAASGWPGTVVATALLGHAVEGEPGAFVTRTIEETLPAVTHEFPGIAIDAFCEGGAWSRESCLRLFAAAQGAGHPVRAHVDQFTSLGLLPEAVRLGARSLDHLEASSDSDLALLAGSATFGGLLPCTGFHTDGRYARGRLLIDRGGAVVVATNFNPGSAPSYAMPFALALAVRGCGLTPGEAIAAATLNAATLLGQPDRGAIGVGQRADLVLLRHRDERALAYEVGGDPIAAVIAGGQAVRMEG